ncbi:MAG: 4'-phosphopantetheinyl transferase superfamily protein [Bdellovibrionales bacterium]|nr:4'-phosphopantetheinyl transferase superfamily protein [Bdellovibrionales bacterium]
MFQAIHKDTALAVARMHKPMLVRPEEIQLMENASARRREQFLMGRSAAREALQALGGPTGEPIMRGERGQPRWPAGYTGSITHAGEIAVAAVCALGNLKSIGIDLEETTRIVDARLTRRICVDEELPWASLDTARLIQIFSAKEALYKALYPITGKYFGFKEARLEPDTKSEGFTAVLLSDLSHEFKRGSKIKVNAQRVREYYLSSVVV